MRRAFRLTIAAVLLAGLPSQGWGQGPPTGPPAGTPPPPRAPASIPKELLLVWGYQYKGYAVPAPLRALAGRPEARKPIPFKDLKREFRKHLADQRFQTGWHGILPGVSRRVDIVRVLGLPDYTETRDFLTRWLFRDVKDARTVVFEFFFSEEDSLSAEPAQRTKSGASAGEEEEKRDPQVAVTIRVIPKERTLASDVRKRFGPPESVEYSENATLQWKYLRGILVEFQEDRRTVTRIIFRVNDVLRLG